MLLLPSFSSGARLSVVHSPSTTNYAIVIKSQFVDKHAMLTLQTGEMT